MNTENKPQHYTDGDTIYCENGHIKIAYKWTPQSKSACPLCAALLIDNNRRVQLIELREKYDVLKTKYMEQRITLSKIESAALNIKELALELDKISTIKGGE